MVDCILCCLFFLVYCYICLFTVISFRFCQEAFKLASVIYFNYRLYIWAIRFFILIATVRSRASIILAMQLGLFPAEFVNTKLKCSPNVSG